MRLWHKKLVPVLPRQQLLGQWRDCCCIAKNISTKGNPNHIMVNKIINYPIGHFITYSVYHVAHEMTVRGYTVDLNKFWKYFPIGDNFEVPSDFLLFAGWHNERYFKQCYHILEEKYDCGAITEEEWLKIVN